jgi:drug/metabolite transporter (DMT)-like permease
MLGATLLFALMAMGVKFASREFSAAQTVMVRGLIGLALTLGLLARAQGLSLRTALPGMHLWRSAVGVSSLVLWYGALGGLPLATAMTLNYTSSVWMACFLMGGAVLTASARIDARLFAAVLAGFAGVGLVLQPTFAQEQLPWALAGLASGVIAALAYLQVTALGRAGEPELRTVFWFSCACAAVGLLGSLLFPVPLARASWQGWGWLVAAGLFGTAAQLLMTAAYARGKTLVNASLHYSGIVFATLLGWMAFGERPGGLALAGMALIVVAGLAATRLRATVAADVKESQE